MQSEGRTQQTGGRMTQRDDEPYRDGAPTVNDVARRAGVSRQTVSNVLNAPERVRETTRRRVLDAIDALGYRPHRSAQNLKARATMLIAYRVPPSDGRSINVVLDRFLHALTDTARLARYQVLLFTATDAEELAAYRDLVRTRTVDGFVLSETNYDDPRIPVLVDLDVPFVTFGRSGDAHAHPWVDVDNALGTRRAVEHLVERGRTRIAYVGWPEGSISGDERARGYREGLAAAGLAAPPGLQGSGEDSTSTGELWMRRWLDGGDRPDAVVAASDLIAIGVLEAVRARGLSVGQDVAVTGFDDTPTAAHLLPPLTSVRQPIEEAAAHAIRLLTDRIRDGRAEAPGLLVAPDLVVREST
jgi:DNA-binding LacI/PurR family transcriptional regulator